MYEPNSNGKNAQVISHICAAIQEIKSDERYPHSPDQEANVFSNAPLALIQMGMKGRVSAYEHCIQIMEPFDTLTGKESDN